MKPILLLDCYVEDDYARQNFVPRFGHRPWERVRASSGQNLPPRVSDFAAVVISGSAASVLDPPPWIAPMTALVQDAVNQDVPLMGVCFGHQLLAWAVNGPGSVRLAPLPEVGWLPVEVHGESPIFDGFGDEFITFVSHSDEVVAGEGLTVLARSSQCDVHAFQVNGQRAWGVQFHAEMGPEETESIVRSRAIRHPHLGLDPDIMLANRRDSGPLAERLFSNFFTTVGL